MTTLRPARLAALLGLLAAPAPLAAQQISLGAGFATDPEAPVEVTAESLAIDQETGVATFSGGVVVVQGGLRLQAEAVEVRYDADGSRIARLVATGGVTLASPTEAAEAERADYDIDAGQVVLEGDVLVTQGRSAISADRMVVDVEAGTAQLDGRVRTVLRPADGPAAP